ncbi:MAG: hypothetical protein R6U01_05235 [Halorubrum sp.]|uniref:DUF7344 domain-containing protein n=1 Tax=Halorubrum sp. TaxID=1879286 RepID=UPI0039710701
MSDESTGEDAADLAVSFRETASRALPPEILEVEYVYGALAHARRRYLCYSLLEDTRRSLTELATEIVAWESDIPEEAVTQCQRDRVYTSLYHTHVPTLVDTGVVDFDEENGTITAAENADEVLAALIGIGAGLDGRDDAHAGGETDAEE